MCDRGDEIADAGYEGFCLGIDVVLQSLELDVMPVQIIDVLDDIIAGRRHMPRWDALETEVQRTGYDLFARNIANRAIENTL